MKNVAYSNEILYGVVSEGLYIRLVGCVNKKTISKVYTQRKKELKIKSSDSPLKLEAPTAGI